MVEVPTKAEAAEEVEEEEIEIGLPEGTVTMEIPINIRDCVVP